ncbi:hypothetical protein COF65_32865 [Bacillus toyonensis]|uniref:hypothetical protein n=1 Tax=Bacillus cereus group TaxID=86661 RepID=UPI000BF28750|nr:MULTISPECIES: hypothetical protein [Bacillus cereus group]PEQ70065.1 hypothetical protein CN474_18010 [Bacillus thuringiensis]PHD30318.1 hypothetical protein COF65_32865 [Bacillus toyonensis]
MPKYFDVTLVGIYGGPNHNEQNHEISGRLYVKTLNRDHFEFKSHDMFVSDTPVTINVNDMFNINKEIREKVASDHFDINGFGEYLAIGGTLFGGSLIGKPRYQLIHSFHIYGVQTSSPADPQPVRTYWIHFTSEDINQWVAARFDVRFAHYHI